MNDTVDRMQELEEVRARLAEAEETLRAIRSREIDALVVDGPDGPCIYTLKGADEPYRILVERMGEGAATLNENGVILFCNDSFADLLQVPLEHLIGASLARHVGERDRPALAVALHEARSGAVRREIELMRADGAAVPVLLSLAPLSIDEGVLVISMVASDLTEQKRSRELVAAERFLRSILEQATEPVVVCDPAGLVTHCSRAALALSEADPVGRPLADAWPFLVLDVASGGRDEPEPVRSRIQQALGGDSVSGVEVRFERQGSEVRHYLFSAGPLHDAREQVVGCIVMLTEITDRKRAEQHQRMLLAELSHRVKNTLASVRSIAAQTVRNAPSVQDFGSAFDGRLKALALAHGVLTRTGWGDAELRDLLRQTLTPYRSGRPDDIALSGPPVRLPARQVVAITLILHELATNAAKYGALSAAGGRLAVQWGVEPNGSGRLLRLRWQESGGPAVQPPGSSGFGTALIERSVTHELDGSARLDYRPDGFVCELSFPLAASGDHLLREAESSAERLRSDFEGRALP